ncbi:uncharacterized protein LOC132638647 isoform X2 [Lycium barbarum]|uniref:uncharacterized protein LOC132638647 isoform X2 n=1 Tax=Lycium barbarum TaxID=112863 RepID=UPI00293F09E8|nr:uncharacterized protein LOC132638647 isoform X2 [Lycium barbarum]
MLPIAWAIVEYENKNTWIWFLKLLIADLGMRDGSNYTVISDMQKGLQSAMKELLPLVEHRMCARHILANWAKGWRGLQKMNQFWKCATSTFEGEMKINPDKMKHLGTAKDVVGPGCLREYHVDMPLLPYYIRSMNSLSLLTAATIRRPT